MLNESDLHNYQLEGIEFIMSHPRSFMIVKMSLGKTIMTLTAFKRLKEQFRSSRMLVVGPKLVIENTWPEELKKWAHLSSLTCSLVVGTKTKREKALKDEADIYLISRDNLLWMLDSIQPKDWKYDFLVLDESTSFKSPKAQRFRRMKRFSPLPEYVVALTGTPAPNGEEDLWSQLYLLDQGKRLGSTITRFRESYFISDYMKWNWTIRPEYKQKIYSLISDITFTVDDSSLDLPEEIITDYLIPMPDELYKQYLEFEKELFIEIGDQEIEAVSAGVLQQKLQQFAQGALYHDKFDHSVWTDVHTLKLAKLQEMVETAAGEPLIIAYSHQFDKHRIKEVIPEAVDIHEKNALQRWKAGELRLLMAHPGSMSHGLNLQYNGKRVIWYGLTWNLEHWLQLNARITRQGQVATHTFIDRIVLKNSVDELNIIHKMSSKKEVQDSLINAMRKRREEVL